MRALGLDVGSKTIGLALCNTEGGFASAWDVLQRSGHETDAREVSRRATEEHVEQVVVGLPLELDGRTGRRARAVLRFVETLRADLPEGIGIELWDERFSTAGAERVLLEADLSRAKRKERIDAVAAQFILQGWLDAHVRKENVRP